MFTFRNLIRLIIFIAFAVLALGAVPEAWQRWNVLLPALSPLLGLGGALAARATTVMALLALPLVLLPLFKGRFFCWRLCPVGFVAELASRVNRRQAKLIRRVPFIGKWLALIILASAAVGYPVLIWTDPLCIFNGFFAAWREPLTWLSAATASGFILIIIASLIAPNIWCHRLCPLGGLEEWLTQLGKMFKTGTQMSKSEHAAAPSLDAKTRRRAFLGIAIGGATGLLGRKALPAARSGGIRPPGAMDGAFNALCARCGNCMKACPYDLIQPDLGTTGVDGLLTPVLAFRSRNPDQEQFCFQECVDCTKVCPTGALRPLTVAQKQQVAIGTARLDKKKCIAWEKGEYCVVCQEFCPYQAITEVEQNGVMCPVIEKGKCRGCGACESQCPALPIAIVIKGRTPQPVLRHPSPQLPGNN